MPAKANQSQELTVEHDDGVFFRMLLGQPVGSIMDDRVVINWQPAPGATG
jgi:hypothetical protein